MEVRMAVLADYANVSEEGKLNIMGIFTMLWSNKEPIVHSQMMVVAQFEFDLTEAGEKQVRTLLMDADGREIFSLSGQAIIPRMPDGSPALYNQLLGLSHLTFPHFGRYEFQILVDDELVTRIPLQVASISGAEQAR